MSLDRFKDQHGDYYYDGAWHEDAESLIQCGMLDFCGCGDPQGNLRYIQAGLQHIKDYLAEGKNLAEWDKDGLIIFGSESARYFFFYWADKEELSEHGSRIPGRLTDKGHQLLADLNELFKEETE